MFFFKKVSEISNFKFQNKKNLNLNLKIKKIFLKNIFKKSPIFKLCEYYALLNFLFLFLTLKKNHISVSVLTTPINFWSMVK
jgi:hypothetical protein